MNFFIELIKSLIFLIFPLLAYSYFENLNINKDMSLFLKISLISSVFLFLIFNNNYYFIIFINIPLFISYIKKYMGTYLVINIFIIFYLVLKMNLSLYIVLFEYIVLLILLNIFKSKLNVFAIVTTYFYSFYIYYYNNLVLANTTFLKILSMIITNYLLMLSMKYMMISTKNKYTELESVYRSYLFKFIHEVKNPIAVCKGYLEIIKTNKNTSKKDINKYISIINNEIDESLNLMEDYLIFGRFAVNLDYMDITLLLEDVYNSFKKLAESSNINLDFDYDEEEVIILGDYNKLRQVLINLIKNSIEARKSNEILNIKIKLYKDNNNIKIELLDNGVGIKDISNIGKEFYTTKVNGTGLGVNFSKTIISMHKGKIKYTSRNGVGTKVLITLPLTEV